MTPDVKFAERANGCLFKNIEAVDKSKQDIPFGLVPCPQPSLELILGLGASEFCAPREQRYQRGNWTMWVLASQRVASPGYSSGDDPATGPKLSIFPTHRHGNCMLC